MGDLFFKVWRADDSEEDAREIRKGHRFTNGEALDAEMAATAYVNQHWSDMSYPGAVEMCVRDPDGTLTRWTVSIEMVPQITARLAKETG